MAKVVHCRDGGRDCDFVARALTEQALIDVMATHLRRMHGLKELSPADREQILAVIRDEGRPTEE